MNILKLIEGYSYIVNKNLVINDELHPLIEKYSPRRNVQVIDFPVTTDVLALNIKSIPKIVFEVTQRCNLQCKYCIFGDYYCVGRKAKDIDLTIDIARKGLDYLYRLMRERYKKEISIGFYGGEPLLRFDLIEEIVEYAKQLFIGWRLLFTLTSNGTILNEKILNFLVNNDFILCISLDGPKNIHDEKRLYANAAGSFNDIWANIEKISNYNFDYYLNKVKFNIVLSKDLPLISVFEFFTANGKVCQNRHSISFIVDKNTRYFREYPYNKAVFIRDFNVIVDLLKEKIKNEQKLLPFESSIYENLIYTKGIMLNNLKPWGDACLFGAKIFIDALGKFHLCEQINNNFSYGDVWNGFDFKRMLAYQQEYLKINKDFCSNCDVRFLCNRCYVTFAKEGFFQYEQEYCLNLKKNIIDKLKEYLKFECWLSERRNMNRLHKPGKAKVERFHQFIKIEKGFSRSAIFDFLKGNIYQVENHIIEAFDHLSFKGLENFIKDIKSEDLTILTSHDTWIPDVFDYEKRHNFTVKSLKMESLNLEIEEGQETGIIVEKLKDFFIPTIYYFGTGSLNRLFNSEKIIRSKYNFEGCIAKCRVAGLFPLITEKLYISNMNKNSCWGNKLAITKDGKIRPCIYSEIVIGDIYGDDIEVIINKAKEYWRITKNDVEICNICELRYACFDCREIAYRKNKNLYEKNPYCLYNPEKGTWKEKENDEN